MALTGGLGKHMNTSRLLVLSSTRRNLIEYPEAFDNAAWSKALSTVTANAAVAPNGTTTADKLIATANLGQHRVDYTPVSAAGTQTFSCYLKSAEYDYAYLRIGTAGGFVLSLVDGSFTGSINNVTKEARDVGNGWWRLGITLIAAANDIVRINAANDSTGADFTGDGTSGIYIWGAKLEQAPSMSRYKPV